MRGRCFNLSLGAHYNTSATGHVGFAHTAHTIYITACREVGSFDVSHQIFDVDIIIVDICDAGIYHFGQIMGRHIRSHTYGDTGSTVDKKIWNAGWHYGGFQQRVVEVGLHVYSLFIKILHHFFSNLLQAAFRVTHGSCTVTVHRTVVALSVYKHVAHSPRLCHTDESAIYG